MAAPRAPIIGNHVWFALEGDTIDAVTVSSTVKPDNDPEANWTSLGKVRSYKPTIEYEGEETLFCATPGHYEPDDVRIGNKKLGADLVIEEVSEFLMSCALGADNDLTASVGATASVGQLLKGWFKFQLYKSDDDGRILSMDQWAAMKIGDVPAFDRNTPVVIPVRLEFLYSTLNGFKTENLT